MIRRKMRKKKSFAEDMFASYYSSIKDQILLSSDEEQDLSRRIQNGDKDSLQKLVDANLRLVVKIAWEYISSGVDLLDLVQEGNLGLIHAARKFDYRKDVRFCTYASLWIKQSICRAIASKRRIIRIPYRKEVMLKKVRLVFDFLLQEKLRFPTCDEVAKYMNIPYEDVVEVLSIGENMVSLDNPTAEAYTSMYELCEDYTHTPDRGMLEEAGDANLHELLDNLEERERYVIVKHYGLWKNEKLTLKQIGMILEISSETVRQIEIRALEKLRNCANKVELYAHTIIRGIDKQHSANFALCEQEI